MLVLLALAPIDVPLAKYCHDHALPRNLAALFEVITVVVGSTGIIFFLILAATISRKWACVPQTFAATWGAGLMADIVKIIVARSRPHTIDLSTATFTNTFHGFLPLFSSRSGIQSFPSGHSATAVGLAVALSALFPRGRWFFATMAALVMASRVIVHAHFPVDVAAGAMIGGLWGYDCYRGRLAPVFARIERSLDHIFKQLQSRWQSGFKATERPDRRTAA